MMDAKRTVINQAALEVLTGIGDIHSKLEYLCSLRGRIFNLNNTVPEALGTQIKAALSDLILAATQSIAQSPNRSMAQYTLDAAGPPAEHGLKNCNGLANGWIFNQALSEEAKAAVLDVHARQWGCAGPDKRQTRQQRLRSHERLIDQSSSVNQ